MPAQFQNIAAAERRISEIDLENDAKVRVLGTVVAKSEGGFVLDDGTGTVQVFINPEALRNVEEKKLVRVFARVLPNSEKFDLSAEIVQDVSSLNVKTYEKVMKLWKSDGVLK